MHVFFTQSITYICKIFVAKTKHPEALARANNVLLCSYNSLSAVIKITSL